MGYFRRGALVERTTTTATSSTALSLLNNSTTFQYFTGSVAQQVNLPSALTLSTDVGTKFILINRSTQPLSVYDGGGNFLAIVIPNSERTVQLQSAANAAGVWTITAGEAGLDAPLRMYASVPATTKLNFSPSNILAEDGTEVVAPPVSSVLNVIASTTIDFQTGVTTGATFAGLTFPTTTVGAYVRVGFSLLSTGVIQAIWSPSSVNLVGLANAGTLFVKTGLPLGYIDLQATAATAFKTAGSTASVIESSPGGVPAIHRFGAGGGAGGSSSGSGTGDDLDVLSFQASFSDPFSENATSALTSINSALTNASYVSQQTGTSTYAISYDATKTATGASTTITLSSAPAFTLNVGDMMIVGTETRQITAVTSQTSVTINKAFALTTLNTTLVFLSQAVSTLDVNNLALDGASLFTDFKGAAFSEILVDYKDNAVVGSNVFVPNLTPKVSFVATNDLTNFTAISARTTNVTDMATSTFLPSSGTSLYLRFFATPTTGTGIVNLIGYKVFLQKALTGASGGIMNSAYGFTNVLGTQQINSSVSVVGGKTTITLGFNYAVGLLQGTAASSIEVLINGQDFPRYVSATVTPDGSFLEPAGNVITLDRDYSQMPFSYKITQYSTTQPVDTTAVNTTYISQLQESQNQGFQAFVNTQNTLVATTTAGTPAAGTFYSQIIGRSPVTDFTQDLKSRMGIERIATQQIYPLQTEFGSNGEPVWAVTGDSQNQVRFVGSGWINTVAVYGNGLGTSNLGDYVEIVFCGTGLNILSANDQASRDYRASVDGGAEGANFYPGVSSVIVSRNYTSNVVMSAVSGLTYGVHTVRIRTNASTPGFWFSGFEVLSTSTNVITSPGVSYNGGKKVVTSAQSSLAYNAAVTGTRGGRVLLYQNAAGVVSQAWQPVNVSQALLTAADHTNEEVVRIYSPREFGSGRTAGDDFSTLSISNTTRSFTLDDDTTTLSGSQVAILNELLSANIAGGFIAFTFVGTGLDIIRQDYSSSAAGSVTIAVDGTTIGTYSDLAPVAKQLKLVSGLPYGTHYIRFTYNTTNYNFAIKSFVVYQPKKPTLPAGAVELADYNVMANYVYNGGSVSTTANVGIISAGVLRKLGVRENTYVGTWQVTSNDPNFNSGWNVNTNGSAGGYFQYTFFGTGIEVRTGTPAATTTINYIISVDGSSNLSTFTTNAALATGLTFVASTGVISGTPNGNTGYNASVTISGLPLGVHTIKVLNNSTAFMYADALDIITPIHSVKSSLNFDAQNALPVGSQAISDNRKTTPLKELAVPVKTVYKASGIAVNPTTTSTTAVPMPDMSLTVRSSGQWFELECYVNTYVSSGSTNSITSFYVDGVQLDQEYFQFNSTSSTFSYTMVGLVYLSPGVHKLDVFWRTGNSGTTLVVGGVNGISRVFTAKSL